MSTLRNLATFRLRRALVALAVATLAGALTVFRADALPPVIDLNSASAGLTVYGDDAGDRSGGSMAAGDIDGDTTDDLIIGAHAADPAGRGSAGETYVFYGGGSLPSTIDLNSTSAGLTIFGDDWGDNSGYSVAAGDIDGDTTDDLIIGAPHADPAGGTYAGETYVIYGGPSLPATIDLNITPAGLTVYGDDAEDFSGSSVAAGDIDGDTTDDLIIGASLADPAGGFGFCTTDRCQAGETYVIYGGDGLPATIDLDSTAADLTVYGDDAFDESSYSVAAGDIDGDTTEDLIIGAFSADPAGGESAGETYVIYGGPTLPATIDLDSTSAGLTVFGDDSGDFSGESVAAGDIDGDTTDDLIIGADGADPAGETYVIYGGSGLPPTIDLNSTSAGLTVYGDDGGDSSGSSVAAGDIDGDTTEDLIIGAVGADPAGRERAGETYVIYGGGSLPATIDLDSASAGLTVYGDDPHDISGTSVAAGDINGDSTDDLIIGANGADAAGGAAAGETYVIYGGPQDPTPTPTDTPVPTNTPTITSTPTDSPTPTEVVVGGISVAPHLGALPLETVGSSGSNVGVLANIAAAIASGAVALGGAAWWARRRRA